MHLFQRNIIYIYISSLTDDVVRYFCIFMFISLTTWYHLFLDPHSTLLKPALNKYCGWLYSTLPFRGYITIIAGNRLG